MKNTFLIITALLLLTPLFSQTWHAQMCRGGERGLLLLKGQTLKLIMTDQTQSYTYDQLLVNPVRDLYTYSCLVNAVLTDQSLIILDNKLSKIKSINLQNLGILRPRHVALEGVHYAWVYDAFENKVFRIDVGLEAVSQSMALNCLCDKVREMIFHNNKLFFACKKGIFSLDNLQNFKLEHRGEVEDFDFLGKRMIILVDNQVLEGTQLLKQGKVIKELSGTIDGKILLSDKRKKCFLLEPLLSE